eukprot:1139377-Pelagomonas_calceolata.AAC.3
MRPSGSSTRAHSSSMHTLSVRKEEGQVGLELNVCVMGTKFHFASVLMMMAMTMMMTIMMMMIMMMNGDHHVDNVHSSQLPYVKATHKQEVWALTFITPESVQCPLHMRERPISNIPRRDGNPAHNPSTKGVRIM